MLSMRDLVIFNAPDERFISIPKPGKNFAWLPCRFFDVGYKT